jgi:mRNA interferase MazF
MSQKGKDFLRPVVVVRQLTSDLFIGVPTTTSEKDDNDYFHNISYVDKNTKDQIQSAVMLLQMKVFSKKRLLNKLGVVSKDQFEDIIKKLKKMVDPIQ